ncbi:hypothetical protein AB0B44_40255, partial [Streptomyces sp. NPDC041003]
MNKTEQDPFSVPSFADEIADGAWAEAWVPGAREVAEVWADPGSLGRQLRLPMGVLPGAAAAAVYTHELTVHTWDLASGDSLGVRVERVPDQLLDGSALAAAPRTPADRLLRGEHRRRGGAVGR